MPVTVVLDGRSGRDQYWYSQIKHVNGLTEVIGDHAALDVADRVNWNSPGRAGSLSFVDRRRRNRPWLSR